MVDAPDEQETPDVYAVSITRRAQKELADLPTDVYERVRNAIAALAQMPRPSGCLKLTGQDGWRLRVSDYRILYEIDDAPKTITVQHIGHRRDVYR